ncbi:hypothetical protein [Bacillus wiedmannii]|uniref:hypothetical protein n=1 Tax=Bacillus wiedmannii TaxID=1890302 RepID=UPI001249403F|nr:hypothetical protein [Bacillus wiedmannii]
MNLLNKKSQHYDVLGRFRVNTGKGEVEFCRVKFMATKHEDVIPSTKIKTGDFEDVSIVVKPTPVKPIVVSKSMTDEEKARFAEAFEETKNHPVTIIEPTLKTVPIKTGEILTTKGLTVPSVPAGFDIIATNPKGKEVTVNSLDLDAFCSKNNLDVEGVQAVIDGAQKTHKKWRFTKA